MISIYCMKIDFLSHTETSILFQKYLAWIDVCDVDIMQKLSSYTYKLFSRYH
jgi:hypothetical protein